MSNVSSASGADDWPTLETERLILRQHRQSDTDAFCAMMADDELARFITEKGRGEDRGTAWRGMAMAVGHWTLKGFGFFAVEEKATGHYVGRVGPWEPEGWPQIECGWTIARPHWGKGYAPEAAIAAIRWTFAQFPDVPRIISLIDERNDKSAAVARKIGETRTDETLNFWGVDIPVWAADRKDWLARFGA